jgi:glycosyltransferase involved in cell wall biosynthesis
MSIDDYLADLAGRHLQVRHLRNASNQGFVRTVNIGMALQPTRDVVILNSDTVVSNDWLDRLRHCAYQRPDIATVTPFSNNATICSYPQFCEDNPLPGGWTPASLDSLFAELNAGESVSIPTGVGFCMYIRRDCLRQVGPFDEATFGRGYGEENDFCMRARDAGWQHRLCADTFVYHCGGVSFGAEKREREAAALNALQELYPEYPGIVAEHIRRDPARSLRLKVFLESVRRSPRQVVLFITHNLGGGTERHVEDLSECLADRMEPMVLRPASNGVMSLRLGWRNTGPAFGFKLPEEADALLDWCRYAGVVRVHFHHTMGVHPWLWGLPDRLGVPYDVTLHDYYLINANPTLTDVRGKFCGEDSRRDKVCAQAYPVPGGVGAAGWQQRQWPLLEGAARVFAPSQAAAALYTQCYPELRPTVVAHPDSRTDEAHPDPKTMPLDDSEPLRVLVLGALSREKGADVLESCALASQRLEIPLHFELIGYAYRTLDSHIEVHGPYDDASLGALVDASRYHVIWFPAQWPETYSYTLSAALRSGAPLVVPDIGAFPERLAARPLTWIEPWDQSPEDWVWVFSRLRAHLVAAREGGGSHVWPRGGVQAESFDYSESYLPCADSARTEIVFDPAQLAAMLQRSVENPGRGSLSRKEKVLVKLVEIRSTRMVTVALRWVPFGVQRRLKRWLSDRPIHEIVSD